MLSIQTRNHNGRIDFDPNDLAAVPKGANQVVVFIADTAQPAPNQLTPEQTIAFYACEGKAHSPKANCSTQ
jgi:hypothetical protein